MDMEELGRRLRRARLAAGLSQAQVAEALGIPARRCPASSPAGVPCAASSWPSCRGCTWVPRNSASLECGLWR
jgi:transcriptional regulator with XRE-family HTH domain